MKRLAQVVGLMLAVSSAAAQETPDYSPEALLRIFAETEVQREDALRFHVGAIELRALGVILRLAYVPLPPLSGSMPRTSLEWPDPFALTRTSIAMPARIIRSSRPRAVSRELRRIERIDRERARVRVE